MSREVTVRLPSRLWKEIVWAARTGFRYEDDYYAEQSVENIPKDWPQTRASFLEGYEKLAAQLRLKNKKP